MADELSNLGLTELRPILLGVVACYFGGKHFQYAPGELNRRNPLRGL